MAKMTNKEAMERMVSAEKNAIQRIFGIRPKDKTEIGAWKGSWYYFVSDYTFRIGDSKFFIRIFRKKSDDVPPTEYYISGIMEISPENVRYGAVGMDIKETKLKSPDDDATIERVLRKEIQKTFGKIRNIH